MQFQCKPVRPVYVPIGPSIAYVELTRGLYALIDSWNAERVGKFNWYANRSHGEFYAIRKEKADGPAIFLHKFLMGIGDDSEGDHISRNRLDCREANLRPATTYQNSLNRQRRNPPKSGIRGVVQRGNRLCVRITVEGRLIQVGSFSLDQRDLAEKAYWDAAAKFHGQFLLIERAK